MPSSLLISCVLTVVDTHVREIIIGGAEKRKSPPTHVRWSHLLCDYCKEARGPALPKTRLLVARYIDERLWEFVSGPK